MSADERPVRFEALVVPMLDQLEQRPESEGRAVETGITDLDRLLGGVHEESLTVIAGYPGIGVTTLSLQFARHAAMRLGRRVIFQSHQEPVDDLMLRCFAAEASIDMTRLRQHRLDDDDGQRLARTAGIVSHAPLWFAAPGPLTDQLSMLGKSSDSPLPLETPADAWGQRPPLIVIDGAVEL